MVKTIGPLFPGFWRITIERRCGYSSIQFDECIRSLTDHRRARCPTWCAQLFHRIRWWSHYRCPTWCSHRGDHTVSCSKLNLQTDSKSNSIETRSTEHVRVVEPMVVISLAYMSYVAAELVHFSGIIALIACGLMQAEYARHNISDRSYVTIKYFTRNVSSISDVIIFFFLGKGN